MAGQGEGDADQVRYWRLYYPSGRAGIGFLSTRIDVGNDITVKLSPRIARMLAILKAARLADHDIAGPAAQGWRSKHDLAVLIAAETGYTVNETSVTAYLTQLTRDVREAAEDRMTLDEAGLIERERGLGARLAAGIELEIIDGNPSAPSSEEPDDDDRSDDEHARDR